VTASPAVLTTETPFDVDVAYREHAPYLARLVARMLGDGPDVDDVLQETFITAFRKRGEFAGRSAVRTWLYSIALHLCQRRRRGLRRFTLFRQRLSVDPAPAAPKTPDREYERHQDRELVRKVLDQLPFKQRETFVLYELERLEGNDIAQLLEVPLGTVWTRLHQARKTFTVAMRAAIAEEGEPR
jgi:RNA polymerase sigma-70 factor (ECF subfamily)